MRVAWVLVGGTYEQWTIPYKGLAEAVACVSLTGLRTPQLDSILAVSGRRCFESLNPVSRWPCLGQEGLIERDEGPRGQKDEGKANSCLTSSEASTFSHLRHQLSWSSRLRLGLDGTTSCPRPPLWAADCEPAPTMNLLKSSISFKKEREIISKKIKMHLFNFIS